MAEQKKAPAKKKRKPAGLTTVQKDALASAEDRKLTSVTEKLKAGEIDTGDFATPEKGVLDPEEFEKFQTEVRAHKTETQRIATVIKEHLNKNYSRGGKFQWEVAFFLPTDPRSDGSKGHQALTPRMIGEEWSSSLQKRMGLTLENGALCWNGRGTVEKHIICVKTKQLQERQLKAIEESAARSLKQPVEVAGRNVGRLEVKEETKKLPLYPAGGQKETGDAVTD